MATLKQKIQAEQRMRELLEQEGMPEPDSIEYGHGCIRLFFEQSKVVLSVDIDEPPEDLGPPIGINLSDDELFDSDNKLITDDDGGKLDDAA